MQRSFRLHLCYTADVPYSLSFDLDPSIANIFNYSVSYHIIVNAMQLPLLPIGRVCFLFVRSRYSESL